MGFSFPFFAIIPQSARIEKGYCHFRTVDVYWPQRVFMGRVHQETPQTQHELICSDRQLQYIREIRLSARKLIQIYNQVCRN